MTIAEQLTDTSSASPRWRSETTPGAHRYSWREMTAIVLVALVVAPIIWTALHAVTSSWIPTGDWAVIELHTREVGTSATPLVGPYSRFGWSHPGPMLYWLLAIPYRLSGSSSPSLLVGAAMLNITAVIGTGWLAWRRGGLRLVAIIMCGTALVAHHMGTRMLEDPWNPSVTVLPLALFVVAVWSSVEGDSLGPPVAVLAGSFLVQSHIGFAPLVLLLGTPGLVAFVRRADRIRPVVIALVAAAVVWSPAVIDQLFFTGNMGDVARYFTASGHRTAGLSYAVGAIAREFGGIGPWLGTLEPLDPLDGHLIPASIVSLGIPLIAFTASFIAARRCGARSAVRFQTIIAAATLIGLLSISRITPPTFNYLLRWAWPLAMLWWASTSWSASVAVSAAVTNRRAGADAVRTEARPAATDLRRVALSVIAAVLIIAIDVQVFTRAGRVGTPDGSRNIPLGIVITETLSNIAPHGTFLVRATGSDDGSIADALRLQLEREGRHVTVDDNLTTAYGDNRSASRHRAATLMWVVSGTSGPQTCSQDGRRIVSRWYPPADDTPVAEGAASGARDEEATVRADPTQPDASGRGRLYDEPVTVCVEDLQPPR